MPIRATNLFSNSSEHAQQGAGDLFGESLGLGYVRSVLLFGGLIAATFLAHRYRHLNAVLVCWTACILTRPLGASLGDWLTQVPKGDGQLRRRCIRFGFPEFAGRGNQGRHNVQALPSKYISLPGFVVVQPKCAHVGGHRTATQGQSW